MNRINKNFFHNSTVQFQHFQTENAHTQPNFESSKNKN